MSQTEECIKKLDMALTDLRAEGMNTWPIMAALAELCVMAAKSDPTFAVANLDNAAAIIEAGSEAIQGKADLDGLRAAIASR